MGVTEVARHGASPWCVFSGGGTTDGWKLTTSRFGRRGAALAVAMLVVVVSAAIATVRKEPGVSLPRPGGEAPAVVARDAVLLPATAEAAVPTPEGLDAALRGLAAAPGLGRFSGTVVDAATGVVLWSVDADGPRVPASTTKILTAFAAVRTLPLDHRVVTRIVEGDAPRTAVLVAGGDPTPTSRPAGVDGYYRGAPHIDDLVRQVRESGSDLDTLELDGRVYAGPDFADGWHPGDVGGGFVAPLQPLMLDGARIDPGAAESPRRQDPAADAARAVAAGLGIPAEAVREGTASGTARVFAEIRSAPLETRLRQMMLESDNVLAESILREMAIAEGRPGSFEEGVRIVVRELGEAGIDTAGLELLDGSGLSEKDRIPPRILAAVLAASAAPDATREESLLGDLLPVAAGSGTLTDRYREGSRDGAGWVRAKTGTLDISSGLAGLVVTRDGRVLSFAFIANDSPAHVARPALDALAGAVHSCGCR